MKTPTCKSWGALPFWLAVESRAPGASVEVRSLAAVASGPHPLSARQPGGSRTPSGVEFHGYHGVRGRRSNEKRTLGFGICLAYQRWPARSLVTSID
jgi:hypothetical protein